MQSLLDQLTDTLKLWSPEDNWKKLLDINASLDSIVVDKDNGQYAIVSLLKDFIDFLRPAIWMCKDNESMDPEAVAIEYMVGTFHDTIRQHEAGVVLEYKTLLLNIGLLSLTVKGLIQMCER